METTLELLGNLKLAMVTSTISIKKTCTDAKKLCYDIEQLRWDIIIKAQDIVE